MKELVKGEIAAVGVKYSVTLDAGVLDIDAKLDFGKLIEAGEAKLPEGSAKSIEIALLEIVKQSVKSL